MAWHHRGYLAVIGFTRLQITIHRPTRLAPHRPMALESDDYGGVDDQRSRFFTIVARR